MDDQPLNRASQPGRVFTTEVPSAKLQRKERISPPDNDGGVWPVAELLEVEWKSEAAEPGEARGRGP